MSVRSNLDFHNLISNKSFNVGIFKRKKQTRRLCKKFVCKTSEAEKSEAYFLYVGPFSTERNAADGLFAKPSKQPAHLTSQVCGGCKAQGLKL